MFTKNNIDFKHYKECEKSLIECLRCQIMDVFLTRKNEKKSIRYATNVINSFYSFDKSFQKD